MTESEFDDIQFCKGDKIELRHYFQTVTEDVQYVNFTYKEINGYRPQQISKYIHGTEEKRSPKG